MTKEGSLLSRIAHIMIFNSSKEKIINTTNRSLMIIFIALAAGGLWQFSNGVRTVDVIGLFASGALAGAAISSFFMARK